MNCTSSMLFVRECLVRKSMTSEVKQPDRSSYARNLRGLIYLLSNKRELSICHSVCDAVIGSIADRIQSGEPEPDVDNFENFKN